MGKGLRISLVIVVLALMATQYQNCSNTSDGAFWDSQGVNLSLPVVPEQTADIKSPRPTNISTPQDFFEIQGVCNPGLGQVGTLSYQIFATNDLNNPIGPNPFYATAKCESGRFSFIVPIIPHQSCSTATYCSYKLRAKMQVSGKQIDLLEYPFNVANF